MLKELNDDELKKFKKDKPLYKPYKSSRANKKGMVYVMRNGKKKLLHFGDASMLDYTQHQDQKRRTNYLNRARGIKNKDGQLTYKLKDYSNYWAYTLLWDGKV
tara:strand:- start:1256 stop:1564 length:309 start_codon:yes stop_codon:yes gene_type:complete